MFLDLDVPTTGSRRYLFPFVMRYFFLSTSVSTYLPRNGAMVALGSADSRSSVLVRYTVSLLPDSHPTQCLAPVLPPLGVGGESLCNKRTPPKPKAVAGRKENGRHEKNREISELL